MKLQVDDYVRDSFGRIGRIERVFNCPWVGAVYVLVDGSKGDSRLGLLEKVNRADWDEAQRLEDIGEGYINPNWGPGHPRVIEQAKRRRELTEQQ